jgi:hypothetical protein
VNEELAHAAGRTTLAWQRTAFSLVVAGAVLLRLTWAGLGPVALVLLAAPLGLGAWVALLGRRGRRLAGRAGGLAPPPTGALATATVLIAVTELVASRVG